MSDGPELNPKSHKKEDDFPRHVSEYMTLHRLPIY